MRYPSAHIENPNRHQILHHRITIFPIDSISDSIQANPSLRPLLNDAAHDGNPIKQNMKKVEKEPKILLFSYYGVSNADRPTLRGVKYYLINWTKQKHFQTSFARSSSFRLIHLFFTHLFSQRWSSLVEPNASFMYRPVFGFVLSRDSDADAFRKQNGSSQRAALYVWNKCFVHAQRRQFFAILL